MHACIVHHRGLHRAIVYRDKKFIPYPAGAMEGTAACIESAGATSALPAAGRFFLSRSCFAGASTMHRGADARAPRPERRGQRRSMLMPLINLRNRFISPRRASRATRLRKSTKKCIRTYDGRLSPGHLKNLTGASFRMWPRRIRFVNEQQPLLRAGPNSPRALPSFRVFSLSFLYRNAWIKPDGK